MIVFAGVGHTAAQDVGDLSERLVTLASAGEDVVSKTDVTVFVSAEIAVPFDGVVLKASAGSSNPSAWVRFVTPTGTGDWLAMTLLHDPSSPVFLAAYHGDNAVASGSFEVAIATGDAAVTILAAGVFDTRLDEDRQTFAFDPALVKRGRVTGNIVPPKLHTRAEWGAAAFIGTPERLARPNYDKMTFHHAACCAASTLEEGLAQVKAIQDFHQIGRGWSDIGYQFLIDQSGRIYQGRPFFDESIPFEEGPPLSLGAHVGGFNTGNIGVSALGCYHPPEGGGCRDMLSPDALDSLIVLFAYLSDTYGVTPSVLRGHRDYSSTACPGDNNYVLIPEIRQRVANLISTGNAPFGTAALNAVVGDDGVVQVDWQFLTDLGIAAFKVERETGAGRTVLFSNDGALNMSLTDAYVSVPGSVRYILTATNANGRTQQLASITVALEAPSRFTLSSNFPNPFSQRTTIRYYLQEDGFVRLSIFDASGRLVDELRNAFQEKGRWYTEEVNADGLSAGLYLYRITVEGFSGVVFDESGTLTIVR